MGRTPQALALAFLLLAPAFLLLAPTGEAQAPGTGDEPRSWAKWWHPDWHMRLPVKIDPVVADPLNKSGGTFNFTEDAVGLVDYPVEVSVDFTGAALAAGWPSASGAITSFTFDEDSLRVVEYDRLDAAGKPLTGKDVPYSFIPTRLDSPVPETFNASTNAVGTVTWIAKGLTRDPRYFFVYFDVLENGKKLPPDFERLDVLLAPDRKELREAYGKLTGLGWVGSGHVLTGYALEPLGSAKNRLQVRPLHTNTSVELRVYEAPGMPPKTGDCPRVILNFTTTGIVTADRDREVLECTVTGPAAFRVIASKPVVATLLGPGGAGEEEEPMLVVPPLDGHGSGKDFQFTAHATDRRGTPTLVVSPSPQCVSGTLRITPSAGKTVALSYPASQFYNVLPELAYRVTASCPVTVHLKGQGVAQFPTAYGGPVDTEASFTTGRELVVAGRVRGSLNIYNEEGGFLVKSQPVPAADNRFIYETASALRTLLGEATVPVSYTAGDRLDRAVVVAGGEHGRLFDFVVPDRFRGVLVPSYENTAYTKTRFTPTGAVTESGRLSLDGYRGSGSDDFLAPGSYRFDAERPVSLFLIRGDGQTPYGYGLPGRLLPMRANQSALEFWGPAVSLRPEEVFVFVKPGDPALFRFGVVNTGRSITGGPITDNLTLDRAFLVPRLEETWDALLSETDVKNLRTGEQLNLTLEVNPLKAPKTGDVVEIKVVARSKANPRLVSSFVASAKVIVLFDFRMTFADGKTEARQEVKNGTTALYRVNLVNVGTGNDTLSLKFVAPPFARDQGWSWEVYEGYVNASSPGTVVRSFALPLGVPRNLTLAVRAPPGSAPPLELKLVAKSTNNTLAERTLTARTAVDVKVDIGLHVAFSEGSVLPGGFVRFPVVVSNEGVDAVVSLRLDGGAPGFNGTIEIPSLTGGEPTRGKTPPGFQLYGFGTPGNLSNRTFFVNVTAGEALLAGERAGFRLTASANAGGEANAERDLPLTAFVGLTHQIEALLDRRTLDPGETVTLPLRVANRGNGEETFSLARFTLPPNWTVSVPSEELTLGRGREESVPLTIRVPPGDLPGAVRLELLARFKDGTSRPVGVDVAVVERREVTATANLTGVDLSAGAVTIVPITLENRGNRLQQVTVRATGPAGWSITFPDEETVLPAAEKTTIPLRVQAPRNATAGTYPVTVTTSTGERLLAFNVLLGSVDLQVVRVEEPSGGLTVGNPVTFGVHVRNAGNVTARGVTVALFVDGKRVSEGRVEVVPGNDTRILPIPWTVTEGANDLRFVIDPDGAFVDGSTDNNEQIVAARKESGLGVPGAGIGTVIAALAVCGFALASRRRNP